MFKGKPEVINDLDLLVIIGFALPVIRKSKQFAALAELAEDWQMAANYYGPGTIDLKLERLIENPTLVPELATVLGHVLRQIDEYGETIPGDLLNEIMPVPGVIFYNFNTSSLRDGVKKLKALITIPGEN